MTSASPFQDPSLELAFVDNTALQGGDDPLHEARHLLWPRVGSDQIVSSLRQGRGLARPPELDANGAVGTSVRVDLEEDAVRCREERRPLVRRQGPLDSMPDSSTNNASDRPGD